MSLDGAILQGRYSITGKLGDGGMQSVYYADDTLVGRRVAVKTPLPGQVVKRFAASAKIAARVNHQNVAKTYDYFEEAGTVFLVEELVDGPNLEDVFPPGGFIDPHCGARLLLSLAKGISASHEAGVVHRDLKPSNVITAKGTLLSVVKITDFGIATLTEDLFADAAKGGDLTRSTSGTVRGALPYMAPEMMFRKPGDHPGRESDIWSLGAMMFKLLSGIYPYGVGFEAAANVKTGDRAGWPAFMTANPQYGALALELQNVIERCLVYNAADRLSAKDLVGVCEKLCFSTSPRISGSVSVRHNSQGRIAASGGQTVFFHRDSFYGPGSATVGTNVMFSCFPGAPYPRAHPVSLLPPGIV